MGVFLAPLLALRLFQAPSNEIRTLPPSEIRGLRVWDQAGQGRRRSKRPGYVTSYWAVRFKNETPKEIGSVTLRLVGHDRGRRSFQSPPATLRTFVNVGVAHRGSLLPGEKSEFDRLGIVAFELPEADLRRAGGGMGVELVSATGFRRVDLHDPGHLYSYLHNMRRPEILAQFRRDPSLLKVRNAQGLDTTLMAFAACDPEVIKYVLAHGGSAKARTDRGATIMHMAAMNGYPGVMDLALKMGGDPNARTASGRTPLMKAISRGQLYDWRWLLAHRANTKLMSEAGETAASIAINEGQELALADLAKAGVSPKARDAKGQGWLDYGVNNGAFLDVVARYGLPIDGRNPLTGATPLMLAASRGVPATVIWFVQHGANPNLKDKQGRNAYDYAALGNVNLAGIVSYYGRR